MTFTFCHQWGRRADRLRRDFDTLQWLCDISLSPLKITVCLSLWILCLPARCKQRYILKTLAIANAAQCYECHKTLLIITRSITYFFYNRSRYQDRWGICTTRQNGRDTIIYTTVLFRPVKVHKEVGKIAKNSQNRPKFFVLCAQKGTGIMYGIYIGTCRFHIFIFNKVV